METAFVSLHMSCQLKQILFILLSLKIWGIGFTGDSSYSSPGQLSLCLKVWHVLRKLSRDQPKSTLESIILVFQIDFSFWKYWTY